MPPWPWPSKLETAQAHLTHHLGNQEAMLHLKSDEIPPSSPDHFFSFSPFHNELAGQ